MLQIRQEQIAEVIEAQRRDFVTAGLLSLRQEFPEVWLRQTDPEVQRLLYDQCERAAGYNVNLADGIYLLFTLRLRLDWNFPEGDAFAWAREILGRDLVPERERLDALRSVLWGEEA